MALQNDTSRIQYNGNNSTTNSYAIPFVFFENSHIKCVVTTSAGVDTELTLGSGFNVTGAGNANGGSLTTTTAVPTSSKVTIFRNVPATQTTSYQEGGDFPAASHERALDKLTMIAQQTKRLADRALKVPETQNNPNDLPNAGTGNRLLGSNNGTLTWEENRQLPSYPATAGTQALVTAGSGAAPSWQTMPAIATGPITATGSTTPRFVADRFGEVFHVDDFGAKGDWNGTSGTDDAPAIQAAINAAVAAGGGVIRFGAGKRYRLHTRTSAVGDWGGTRNTHFLRVGSGSNTSGFGSTSMRLLFDGQNATLHASNFVEGQTNDIIYTFCRFQEICFRDLRFTRNNWITAVDGNLANALAFTHFDLNYSDLVRIENCYFHNHLHSIYFDPSFSNHVAWSDVAGKLKRLEVVGCVFEHPNGDSRVLGYGGLPQGVATGWPGVTVFNSPWIDTAVYDRCYADGCTNATVPAGYHEPMHGFLFPMPIKCQITNCYFKNFYVEIIKASDAETAGVRGLGVNGGFTQVAVNSQITLTVATPASPNQKLTVGRTYCLFDPAVYQGRRGGYFRLEAKTGGGNYSFTAGEQLNFTRVAGTEYQLPSNLTIGAGQTFSNNRISFIDMDAADQYSLQVANCIFEGNPIKKSDGQPLRSESVSWYAPAILCSYKCAVIGNSFVGGGIEMYADMTACNHHQTIFANNVIQKFSPRNDQIENLAIYLIKGNCLVVNNYITYRQSKDTRRVILVSGHEIIIKDNVCIVLNPSSVGSNGVTSGPFFVQYSGGGPWRVLSENNYLKDLEHYGSSQDAGHVASYVGSIRGSFARIAYPSALFYEQASAPIRLAKQHKSSDGSTWTIGVTNDGELEVTK